VRSLHHQRGNPIGPLCEYNRIRVVIEMTPGSLVGCAQTDTLLLTSLKLVLNIFLKLSE
jgi:hypothetical protein